LQKLKELLLFEGYNRTLINKNDSPIDNGPVFNQNISQDSYMSAIEKDANERYQQRQINEKLADELKNKGNEEFGSSNFEKAIDYYTQV
jgi:hypothetical protein